MHHARAFLRYSQAMLFVDYNLRTEGLSARTTEEAFGEYGVDLAGSESDWRQGEGHG